MLFDSRVTGTCRVNTDWMFGNAIMREQQKQQQHPGFVFRPVSEYSVVSNNSLGVFVSVAYAEISRHTR